MTRKCLNPGGAEHAGFSQVVADGQWINVSGQLAFSNGVIVGKGDPDAQVKQVFDNLSEMLALAGATLADVVKLTCYLTDINAYPAYSKYKAALYPKQAPAGTTVIVAGLLIPDALLEVEALAYKA